MAPLGSRQAVAKPLIQPLRAAGPGRRVRRWGGSGGAPRGSVARDGRRHLTPTRVAPTFPRRASSLTAGRGPRPSEKRRRDWERSATRPTGSRGSAPGSPGREGRSCRCSRGRGARPSGRWWNGEPWGDRRCGDMGETSKCKTLPIHRVGRAVLCRPCFRVCAGRGCGVRSTARHPSVAPIATHLALARARSRPGRTLGCVPPAVTEMVGVAPRRAGLPGSPRHRRHVQRSRRAPLPRGAYDGEVSVYREEREPRHKVGEGGRARTGGQTRRTGCPEILDAGRGIVKEDATLAGYGEHLRLQLSQAFEARPFVRVPLGWRNR